MMELKKKVSHLGFKVNTVFESLQMKRYLNFEIDVYH